MSQLRNAVRGALEGDHVSERNVERQQRCGLPELDLPGRTYVRCMEFYVLAMGQCERELTPVQVVELAQLTGDH